MQELVKKVCLCGDPAVGKTSLIRRFVTGKYDDNYLSTLGSVISKKNVYNPGKDTNVKMMVWDISGQDEFKRVHKSGFNNANGAIAVCDITRPDTIEHITVWLKNLRTYAGNGVPAVVLTNKFDLIEEDPKKAIKIHKKLKTLGCRILTTSAKTGFNVEKAFKVLVDAMLYEGSAYAGEKEEEPVMPKKFNNPIEVLDYISIRFSWVIGDQEMGMYILRKQVSDEGIDFLKLTLQDLKKLFKPLVKVVYDLRGEETGKEFRKDLIRAHNRCS